MQRLLTDMSQQVRLPCRRHPENEEAIVLSDRVHAIPARPDALTAECAACLPLPRSAAA